VKPRSPHASFVAIARSSALTGIAVLHRYHRAGAAAETAATDAMELYRAGDPRRFRNRIDPHRDLRVGEAACCVVLAAIAAEDGEPQRAATLLGRAERLRADAGTDVPVFQQTDVDQARRSAVDALGPDGFAAAFERGRLGDEAARTP
jgi:hypothetical protein